MAQHMQCALTIAAHLNQGGVFLTAVHCNVSFASALTLKLEPMDTKSKKSKRRDDVLSSLNVVIEGLNLAENLSSITPAKAVFGTVSVILTMIRVSFLLFREDPL